MTDPVHQAQVEAARAYESLFVAALFEQWAPHVIAASRVKPGHRVLDVATGTGILARTISRHVGADGYVAALDPNPGMLAVAREIAPSIDWRHGAAEAEVWPSAWTADHVTVVDPGAADGPAPTSLPNE